MNSYIYLIQDGEFINTDVYKVGRTSQMGDTRSLSRIKSYNKDTIQKYLREVNNDKVIDIESDIKRVFKLKYVLVKGTEWFDGNYKHMITDIDIIVNKYNENNCIKSINNDIIISEKYSDKIEADIDISYFENKNIICFLNGIYNLDTYEFKQCIKFPNNCLTTNINYIETPTSEEYKKIAQLKEILFQILPIERVKNYILTLLASFLNCNNKDNKLHIWTGGGGNGKSTLINLYNKTLGEYSYNILNNNKNLLKDFSIPFNKRLISLDNINIKKYISKIIKNTDFINHVYITNELPKISSDDDETWLHIKVVEFISNFCDNPDPNKKYEFKNDIELKNKIDDYKESFMHILIEYYKNYKINGIQEPLEIVKNTQSYRIDNDIYRTFVDENIYKDDNSKISIDDIYPIFRNFLDMNGINKNKYNIREFINRINIIIGQCSSRNPLRKKIWYGYGVKLT